MVVIVRVDRPSGEFFAAYEGFGSPPSFVVGELLRRRLHEIARRTVQGAADATIQRELGATHGIDDDAGRIGGVPDLQLELAVQRNVAERGPFHADVAPFAVAEPRNVVAWADMRVLGRQRMAELARDGAGLGNLLGFEALSSEERRVGKECARTCRSRGSP